MKKKMIELVPFDLCGQKTRATLRYKVTASLKDKYILFDFYLSIGGNWLPNFRCVIGPKEFENYNVETGVWDKQKISYRITQDRYGIYSSLYNKELKKFDISDETRELAKKYFNNNCLQTYSNDLISQIEQAEDHIAWEYKMTAAQKKHIRIQEKMAELDPIPKDFKRFLTEKVYKNDHFLYFSEEKAFCSRCGRKIPAGTYKHNQMLSCPSCKKKVIAKSVKRFKDQNQAIRKEVLIMQSKGEEIILRYVKTCLAQDGKNKERISFTESVRTYHQNDIGNYKNRYIHYFDNMVGGDYWTDRMACGIQVAYGRKTILYTNNWEDLQTIVNKQWLDLMKYWTDEGMGMPLLDFLLAGKVRVEVIERLYKAGLKKLATEQVKHKYDCSIAWQEKELKKVLKVSKPLFNWAQKTDATARQIAVLQDGYKSNLGLSDAEIIELAKACIKPSEIKVVARNNKIMKTYHYLQKAAGYKNLTERFKHYADYIGMAEQLRYDLDNDTVRYPKNIKAAHDKAATELNMKEMDNKILKATLKYPLIGLVKDELNRDFGFKDKTYEIIAPVSAGDIMTEGRILHHCVGSEGYLSKHNSRKTFILFLRKLKEPEERYYTIEIDPYELKILQYYGAYDKKPDKEQVDKFLNKWKQYLSKKHYLDKKEAV